MEKFVNPPVFAAAALKPLVAQLRQVITGLPGCEIMTPDRQALANTLAFSVRDADGIALLAALDMEGICASSGSACSAGSLEPSHVLLATHHEDTANSLVRFSLGRHSSRAEVDAVCALLPAIIRRAQHG